MRFQKKYKSLSLQSNNKSIDIPIRILKFKRTKWNSLIATTKKRKRLQFFLYLTSFLKRKVKKNIVKDLKKSILNQTDLEPYKILKYNKRLSFYNSKIQIPLKKWERINKVYKTSLSIKNYYYQLYDNNMQYKLMKKRIFSYKKIKDYNAFFQSIMQFEFRLDILLWRLRFFKTSHQSSLFINHKFVKVNSKTIKNNYILKAGDIISFEGQFNFLYNLKRLKKTFLFMNFIEIDYYTNSIVVLYSYDNINKLDFSLFMKQYFDLMKFSYSFK